MHVRVHFKELPFMMFCIHENVWCVSLEKNSYNRMDKNKCTICNTSSEMLVCFCEQ